MIVLRQMHVGIQTNSIHFTASQKIVKILKENGAIFEGKTTYLITQLKTLAFDLMHCVGGIQQES